MRSASWSDRASRLQRQGLYDPNTEHDACGVGLVAAINGRPSRAVVELGIAALKAVYHRGAVDADGKTGDGAGIHLQIPVDFFRQRAERMGKRPFDERLAVGMIFLPKKNLAAQEACRAIVETEIVKLGYHLFGWRRVPVQSGVIGDVANDSRPEIEQILVGGKPGQSEARFELELFFIRRRIENAVRARAIADFYICSLSCRSLIYKGLFKAEQLTEFYPDLLDESFTSSYVIFHQRFSTNTAPAWHLAQPFRVIAHNGEINTLKGNVNFMRSHEATFSCEAFAGFEEDIVPVIPDHTSDTGALDSVMEILTRAGRPLPLSKLILIPPAWSMNTDVPESHKHLFSFCNTVSEPWDGPAAIAASDGAWVMAGMDRSGLRPMRYAVTAGGLLAAASESGMVPLDDDEVVERGRLGPGDIIGVNLAEGRLYKDKELKDWLAAQHPYEKWVSNILLLREVMAQAAPATKTVEPVSGARLRTLQLASGHSMEEIEVILHTLAAEGKEAVGSMGDDTAMTVLSERHRPFHHFFRQNFSQVTNPPIDPLRERRVMSLFTRFGNDGNYLALDATHSKTLLCATPVLLGAEIAVIEAHFAHKITRLDTLFAVAEPGNRLRKSIDRLQRAAEEAVRAGRSYLLLSDEHMDEGNAAIPMILAVSAIHSHLVRQKLRKKASILVKSAECIEPHALAVLIGAGATVVHPYVAEATLIERHRRGLFSLPSQEAVLSAFREAMGAALLKIMSKMGISVVSSYRGGLNFEAIGLARALVAEFFPGLPSRISGIGIKGIEKRVLALHAQAFAEPPSDDAKVQLLPLGG
ncbi:MAG: glutamate synthase large subunit, partial [Alphaproteobacteria bacterium]|nr:glutamate synthase large subunit [Alphaproteobacteria bacterium]